MNSTETRKFILRFILVGAFYSPLANANCDSNKRLYIEIGCQPVYGNNSSNDCPIAYDCENVFSRPNDKCYFNEHVYKPLDRLSLNDSERLNPCLAGVICHQRMHNNITETKFKYAQAMCPSHSKRPAEPCYFRFNNDRCCETYTYCPDQKEIVYECTYNYNVYKKGERIYLDDYTLCVCSKSFNGTFNDASCRKIGCDTEIIYVDKILKWSAPIFYEKANGCPIEWYDSDHDIATLYATLATSETGSGGPVCRYGNLRLTVGQNVTISSIQSDWDTYKTTCSCSVPPLVTCIKTKYQTG